MTHTTTLRLATIDVELGDDRGNVVQECIIEITTVDETLDTPTVTQHALNQGLGNSEGRFDTKGTNFFASARRVRFSFGLLSAELCTSRREWETAKIALRAKATFSGGSWTHKLIIADTHDPTLENALSAIVFVLGSPCWNLRLRDDGVLMANCFVCDSATRFQSRSVVHAIHLNRFVGNNNGSFDANDSGFMASARNVRMRGSLLCAELRTVRGGWKEAEIRLDSIIRVDGCFGAKKPGASYRFDVRLREEVPVAAALHSPPGTNEMRRGPHLLYPPLEALEDSYRICYIEPGLWDDPICCTTATWRAKDGQRYSCLSYVCGDQNHTVEIRLNSHAKSVTHNLFVALRRLRCHGVRAIWIDALCINQADNEEKCKQVSRMTATYANAFRVIIWLGSFPLNADDLEDHVRALEESMFAAFLRRLVSGAHISDAIEDARNVAENAGQLHAVRQTAIGLQRVCYRLSRSGWFSRTWTVQEHIMARQSVFAFGDEVIDAKAAFHAIDLASSHINVQNCCSDSTSDHDIKVFMDEFVDLIAAF
ncbi:hypothetical protein Q7P35_011232 [Cladosporium inversicolor]